MTWSPEQIDRLLLTLEGIRHILASCCAAIERVADRAAPPPSSKKGKS